MVWVNGKNYKVLSKLGSGAFGTVYKVREYGQIGLLALKQIALSSQSSDVAREIRSNQALPVSRFVVSFLGYSITEDLKYLHILLDFCNKGTLNDYILSNNVSEECKAGFMLDLLEGLKHLQKHNIVHRDIKPDNILLHQTPLSNRPVCKLSDFGLARFAGSSSGSAYYDQTYYLQSGAGTFCFMAPEVISGHYTDVCDIFSLGVVYCAVMSSPRETDGTCLIASVKGKPMYQASYSDIENRVRRRVKRESGADSIVSMLNPNYKKRISLFELDLTLTLTLKCLISSRKRAERSSGGRAATGPHATGLTILKKQTTHREQKAQQLLKPRTSRSLVNLAEVGAVGPGHTRLTFLRPKVSVGSSITTIQRYHPK